MKCGEAITQHFGDFVGFGLRSTQPTKIKLISYYIRVAVEALFSEN